MDCAAEAGGSKALDDLLWSAIYADDDSAPTHTKVGITTRLENSLATLQVPLRAAGGQAVWITANK
jgi:hypothetical protein